MYSAIKEKIASIAQQYFDYDAQKITCEPCRNDKFGDISCNFLMVAARDVVPHKQEIQEKILAAFEKDADVAHVRIDPPGFINITMQNHFWQKIVHNLLTTPITIDLGKEEKTLVEFASVNPTGPMHIGHARNAILGDTIARLLDKTGYTVAREFYINDAGQQVMHLAKSLYLRYLECLGEAIAPAAFTKDMYVGEYLIPIAQEIAEKHGSAFHGKPEDLTFFKDFALAKIMTAIKQDLSRMDVHMDHYFSETSLVESRAVEAVIAKLNEKGDIYKGILEAPKGMEEETMPEGDQTIFASTKYGDDKDRVLVKSDGSLTYFATDVAYHAEKFNRGYQKLINVLGADHIGYVKRIQAATSAVTDGACHLDVKICQLVSFLKDGKALRMSKREGNLVEIPDVIDEIGISALRFMLLFRRSDVAFDFDLKAVVEKSRDNPVFYVQYAYARISSAKNRFIDIFKKEPSFGDLSLLTAPHELAIIKLMADLKRQLEMSVYALEPQKITEYLYNVASVFHGLWTVQGYKIIDPDDEKTSTARINLLQAVEKVLSFCFDIVGIEKLKDM